MPASHETQPPDGTHHEACAGNRFSAGPTGATDPESGLFFDFRRGDRLPRAGGKPKTLRDGKEIPRGGTQSFQRHLLTGKVGKIPTPFLVEGAVAMPRRACGRSKSFSSMAAPSCRGAQASIRGETYVAQFLREPCASLGHAKPIVEHKQLRYIIGVIYFRR